MEAKPEPFDLDFDLDTALTAIVGIKTRVAHDAFTAETLGTERIGHGVLISDDGLILTVGYLITEAAELWITLHDGRVVAGHVLGYDYESGLGLVQALARLQAKHLELGQSNAATVGSRVVIAGTGGRRNALVARIVAKQAFAGYWEYLLDEAIFTAPSHPNWGGAALIGPTGDLLGIGSLHVGHEDEAGRARDVNMIIPIDLLKPVLEDLKTLGQPNRPARPWLGVYAAELSNRVVIAGLSGRGPAHEAKLRRGDVVLGIAGAPASSLAEFFRRLWSLGAAGVEVPLQIERNDKRFDVIVRSADRRSVLKGPVLH